MQWGLILLLLMGQCCFINSQLYEFHYIRQNKTWTEAQQYCRENHTDLVTVTNMADMKILLSESGNMSEAWIGLYDPTDVNITWYWSLPGVEFNDSGTNWRSGEPTGTPKAPKNCGSLRLNLMWADGCQWIRYFICYDETNSTHKYHLIKEEKTWQKAQSYCRENHTDLVSGWNQLQDEELKKVMDSVNKETYIYFGLFRDTWRWSDGRSFSFRHWNDNLNNTKYNSGQCAVTVFDDEGRWKKENCNATKPFICYDDKVILIKEKMTWKDALYYCRDHHHALVTIPNLDELRWVQEKAKNASTKYVWMGLRYNCVKNIWFWVCKEMVNYLNQTSVGWMNNCDMSGAMATGGDHRWFQRNETEKLNFICSKV